MKRKSTSQNPQFDSEEESIIEKARKETKIGESGLYKLMPIQVDQKVTRNIPVNHKKTSIAYKDTSKQSETTQLKPLSHLNSLKQPFEPFKNSLNNQPLYFKQQH